MEHAEETLGKMTNHWGLLVAQAEILKTSFGVLFEEYWGTTCVLPTSPIWTHSTSRKTRHMILYADIIGCCSKSCRSAVAGSMGVPLGPPRTLGNNPPLEHLLDGGGISSESDSHLETLNGRDFGCCHVHDLFYQQRLPDACYQALPKPQRSGRAKSK